MAAVDIPELDGLGYELHEWRHASAVLRSDFPEEWSDLCANLAEFKVLESHVMAGGGGRSKIAQSHDQAYFDRGWVKKRFDTHIRVDKDTYDTPTHEIDCYKNKVALELEWSNKDPFFDRDLNNFRLLFDLRAIHVGIIVTKAESLRPVFEELGVWPKYGTSTTWIPKLIPRIEGGGGGGCPIFVVGITPARLVKGK